MLYASRINRSNGLVIELASRHTCPTDLDRTLFRGRDGAITSLSINHTTRIDVPMSVQ